MKTRKEFLEILHDNHLSDLVTDEVVLGTLEKMDPGKTVTLFLPTQFGMPEERKITVGQRIAAVKEDIEVHRKTLEVIEEKLKEEK
jgi:hypothetical protein